MKIHFAVLCLLTTLFRHLIKLFALSHACSNLQGMNASPSYSAIYTWSDVSNVVLCVVWYCRNHLHLLHHQCSHWHREADTCDWQQSERCLCYCVIKFAKFIQSWSQFREMVWQNTVFTPDKELSSLMYGMPFCVVIYRSCKHLKTGLQFLWPTLYIVVSNIIQ